MRAGSMEFVPGDFLEFASKIHGDSDLLSPAGMRTVISRCYYSALLTAYLPLTCSGMTFKSDDDIHGAVVRVLMPNVTNSGYWSLGDDLVSMNEMRIAADLDPDSHLGVDDLRHAYSMACIFNREAVRYLDS